MKTFLALCIMVAVGVMAASGQTNAVGKLTILGGAYEGEIKDGKANGQGTWTHPNGIKYVGEWKDDKKNGQGTLTYSEGGNYVGEFKDDMWNGQGTLTRANGRTKSGLWKDGQGPFPGKR
jgi:hypothetical protein